jgi:hypothetical protein
MNKTTKHTLASGILLFSLIAVLLCGCSTAKPVSVELAVSETPVLIFGALDSAPFPEPQQPIAAGTGGAAGAAGSCAVSGLGQSPALQSCTSGSQIGAQGGAYAEAPVTFEQVWMAARNLITKGDAGFTF